MKSDLSPPGTRVRAPAQVARTQAQDARPEVPRAPLKATGAGQPFLRGRWISVRAALAGAAFTLRTQPNAWIELAAFVVVMGAAWFFRVSPVEWAVLGLTILAVLALEAVNTAIEAVVDLVAPEYHPLARVAKDAAAGALIFMVVGSLIVAGAIFGPRLLALLG